MPAKRKTPPKKQPRSNELAKALERLRTSPCFEMLKNVRLEAFLPAGTAGDLAALSLGELSSYSGKQLSKISIDTAALEKLHALAGESGPAAICAPSGGATTIIEQPASAETPFASSQLEQQLVDAFSRLTSAAHFERERSRTLGEFWQPGWPKAPFEQCLTLSQLSKLTPETFLKKRSLGPSKIAAVIGAINAFVDRTPLPARTQVMVASNSEEPPRTAAGRPLEKLAWKERHSLLPAGAHLISYFELRVCARTLPAQLAAVLEAVPAAFGAAEFLLLWSASQSHELAALLTAVPAEEVAQRSVELRARYISLIEREAPQLYYHWNSSLAGAGALKRELLEPYRVDPLEDDFEAAMWELFLFAFGAGIPRAFGIEFGEFRAKRINALEVILNTLLATLPRLDAELRADLGVLLPHFPIEKILAALRKRAMLDPEDGQWKAAM